MWAFNKSKSFKHGVLLAVNLGGDADTVGALYGQLAGAYYGGDSIPNSWQLGIVKWNTILYQASRLYITNVARSKKKKPVVKLLKTTIVKNRQLTTYDRDGY